MLSHYIKIFFRILGRQKLFAGFNIFGLAIVGLLGLVAYTTKLKTKEIGIRKIPGQKIFDHFPDDHIMHFDNGSHNDPKAS